jgi:hypothetical protein
MYGAILGFYVEGDFPFIYNMVERLETVKLEHSRICLKFMMVHNG